jgi:hypothetical protein
MDHEGTTERTGGRKRMQRRGVLRAGIGALAGLVLAYRGTKSEASVMHIEDYCYFKRIQGPNCTNHKVFEYQCEYCCGGGTCELVSCAWYITGSC